MNSTEDEKVIFTVSGRVRHSHAGFKCTRDSHEVMHAHNPALPFLVYSPASIPKLFFVTGKAKQTFLLQQLQFKIVKLMKHAVVFIVKQSQENRMCLSLRVWLTTTVHIYKTRKNFFISGSVLNVSGKAVTVLLYKESEVKRHTQSARQRGYQSDKSITITHTSFSNLKSQKALIQFLLDNLVLMQT